MGWALALAFGKRIFGAAWQWLNTATIWQIGCVALIIFAAIQHFEIADARHDAASYLKQRDAYKAQLDAISTKRNEQKIQTEKRIVSVTRTIREADGRAKVIEAAPLPGGCQSPKEVLDADL